MINDLNAKIKHLENENFAVKEAMTADYARLEKTLNFRLQESQAQSQQSQAILKGTLEKQDQDRQLIMEVIN